MVEPYKDLLMVTGWLQYKYCRTLIVSKRSESSEVNLLWRRSETLYLYLSLFRTRVDRTVACETSLGRPRVELAEILITGLTWVHNYCVLSYITDGVLGRQSASVWYEFLRW